MTAIWLVLGSALGQSLPVVASTPASGSTLAGLVGASDIVVVGTVERSSVEEPVPGWPITWAEVRVSESLLGGVTSGLIRIGLPGGRTGDGGRVVLSGTAHLLLGATVVVFGTDVDGASVRLQRGPYSVLTVEPTSGAVLDANLDSVAIIEGDLAPGGCRADPVHGPPPLDCIGSGGTTLAAVRSLVASTLAQPGAATGRTLGGYVRPEPAVPGGER